MDGAASDLRTGLPWQMVEIHEPVRLLFIIETTPEAMLRIMERNPAIGQLFRNDWVQLAVLDPDSAAIQLLSSRPVRALSPRKPSDPRVANRRSIGIAAGGTIWDLLPLSPPGELPPARERSLHELDAIFHVLGYGTILAPLVLLAIIGLSMLFELREDFGANAWWWIALTVPASSTSLTRFEIVRCRAVSSGIRHATMEHRRGDWFVRLWGWRLVGSCQFSSRSIITSRLTAARACRGRSRDFRALPVSARPASRASSSTCTIGRACLRWKSGRANLTSSDTSESRPMSKRSRACGWSAAAGRGAGTAPTLSAHAATRLSALACTAISTPSDHAASVRASFAMTSAAILVAAGCAAGGVSGSRLHLGTTAGPARLGSQWRTWEF